MRVKKIPFSSPAGIILTQEASITSNDIFEAQNYNETYCIARPGTKTLNPRKATDLSDSGSVGKYSRSFGWSKRYLSSDPEEIETKLGCNDAEKPASGPLDTDSANSVTDSDNFDYSDSEESIDFSEVMNETEIETEKPPVKKIKKTKSVEIETEKPPAKKFKKAKSVEKKSKSLYKDCHAIMKNLKASNDTDYDDDDLESLLEADDDLQKIPKS